MPTNRRNRNTSLTFYKSLYLTNRLFFVFAFLVLLAIVCFVYPSILLLLPLATALFMLLIIVDFITLYRFRNAITAKRELPERFSNGDENEVTIRIKSHYPFFIHAELLEEVPFQFQQRNIRFPLGLAPHKEQVLRYTLRPVERGSYEFGKINIFVRSRLSLIKRRYAEGLEQSVKTYPSFLKLGQYEFLLVTNKLTHTGIKRVRRIGNATEFEHIKSYVIGDDPRTINYKATARTNELMVNTYMEERSQSVYCIIDKGRTMQMPFEGLTLLDYAINSSLVLSNTALRKGDKAGIITFSNTVDGILPASDRRVQRSRILDMLYKQQTEFKEASFADLYMNVKRTVKQRSLLILFTNFETVSSLRRQANYLKLLSRDHLLVVAFFLNAEMEDVLEILPDNEEAFFRKSMAEKMRMDKNLIAKELKQHGIHTILTLPENLSVQSINKYLEVKTRGLI